MDVNEELKFCENSKKKIGGGGGGVRVDVIEESKFLGKFTKKKNQGEGQFGGGGSGWASQDGCE